MSSFLDLVDAVGAYYGTGSDQWRIIAQGGINSPEALNIISQVPGVNVTTSNSGQILGYDFENAFPSSAPAGSVINSNAQTGAFNNSFSSNIPANAVPPSTDLPNGGMNSGAVATNTGLTLSSVADKVSLALAGVALGTKLGKMIDAGIYAINPSWFDQHMPTINPETWDNMASTEAGKNVIRAIFGLQNDSATMYLDERLLAQMYMVLKANGAYNSGGYILPDYTDTGTLKITNIMSAQEMWEYTKQQYIAYQSLAGNTVNITPAFETAIQNLINQYPNGTPFGTFTNATSGGAQGGCTLEITVTPIGAIGDTITLGRSLSARRVRPYYSITDNVVTITSLGTGSGTVPIFTGEKELATGIQFSPLNVTESEPIPGVANNPNASTYINPDLITGDNLDDVLNQLKTNYPNLFDDSIYTDVPQPDGTTNRITYIPVPFPNQTTTEQPTTDTTPNVNPQTDPQVNPSDRPTAAEDIATEVTSPVNNAPDTGTGSSPATTPPTGGASSLWAVYNPTQAQVDDFGAWLWSSNFVEQIKKLFADPMQGIIGLHKIFATPSTGATQNIKVGYLDSGVPSAVVTSQYTDIDCGSVNITEYFGNVFDYEDTNIRLYLPFIGIVDLSTSDIMRGNIRVVYHVDVITGACLADVIVSRDSAGGVLYQYSGDAAVRYPVSSGSYMGMVNGVLAIAGAVIGVASGGAALPAVMGAVGGIMNSHTDVKHSGSFSGAAGAMGAKIPYLIIERPQTAMANDFVSYQGIGDNRVVNVGSLAGHFKMTDIHTDGVINASEQEIEQIKALLEGGVIK